MGARSGREKAMLGYIGEWTKKAEATTFSRV